MEHRIDTPQRLTCERRVRDGADSRRERSISDVNAHYLAAEATKRAHEALAKVPRASCDEDSHRLRRLSASAPLSPRSQRRLRHHVTVRVSTCRGPRA